MLLAILLLGESFALFFGICLKNKHTQDWADTKNLFLLFADFICGVMLLVFLTSQSSDGWFWFPLGMIYLTHAFREYELLARLKNPFCSNLALFILNNLKIILSASAAVIYLTFDL